VINYLQLFLSIYPYSLLLRSFSHCWYTKRHWCMIKEWHGLPFMQTQEWMPAISIKECWSKKSCQLSLIKEFWESDSFCFLGPYILWEISLQLMNEGNIFHPFKKIIKSTFFPESLKPSKTCSSFETVHFWTSVYFVYMAIQVKRVHWIGCHTDLRTTTKSANWLDMNLL
jgi:hypothetical protein